MIRGVVHVGGAMVCIGSARLFGYQYVGISNMHSSRWGLYQMRQRAVASTILIKRSNSGTSQAEKCVFGIKKIQ